jgi:TPP-dependent pyruvate/acetoin dehydrogenase alpha subunit
MDRKGGVVICIFGDGASNRGDFHEGLNLAAALQLPVVFVLANNRWAISVPLQKATGGVSRLSLRAAGYGIPGVTVDGNDVRKIYEETSEAIKRARTGKGPTLLECLVHRWTGHSMSDPDTYRTEKEKKEGEKGDPVLRFKKELVSEGRLSEDEYVEIEQRVAKEIEEAIHYAEVKCSNLDPEPFDILRGVYAAS